MTVANHGTNKAGGLKPDRRQSITQHPLFPAIVALWCGAAFGVGSLLLSPALAERLVAMTGIGRVLPMAAPPLGSTARILIALGLTALGAVIGLIAARRISRPAAVLRIRRREAAADSAPVFAEGFGEAGQDEALEIEAAHIIEAPKVEVPQADAPRGDVGRSALPGRRRGLTAQENPPPVDVIEPQILDVAELDLSDFDAEPVAPQPPAPVDLAEPREESGSLFDIYARTLPNAAAQPDVSAEAVTPRELSFSAIPDAEPVDDELHRAPAWFAHEIRTTTSFEAEPVLAEPASASADDGIALPEAPETPEALVRSGAERIASAQLDELSPVELLERLAIAMARSRELRRAWSAPTPTPASEAANEPAFAPPPAEAFAAPEPATLPAPVEADEVAAPFAAPSAPAPLAFTRLALQPLAVDEPAQEQASAFAPPVIEAAEPVVASPAPFAPPTRIPAALRPVPLDGFEDDDDDALPGYIPPRHIGLAVSRVPDLAPPAHEPQPLAADEPAFADGDEDDALEQGYSSLLDLSRPSTMRQPFIRIDEPEEDLPADSAVVFPSSQAQGGPFSPPPSPLVPAGGMAAPAPRLFDAPGRGDARETEMALRAALATLQQMSGAA